MEHVDAGVVFSLGSDNNQHHRFYHFPPTSSNNHYKKHGIGFIVINIIYCIIKLIANKITICTLFGITAPKEPLRPSFHHYFTDINLAKQIDSAKYTVVHIATHGNFSSNLEETYILSWDKLLKLEDIDRLFQINSNTNSQGIQLLVLSACETANGDKRATLGLSGIAIRAGARSTLASLWAVEDESTAQLMSQFYQELQQNKLNKAKALQQAQIKLLNNSETPLIWAPYVLVGNWL